VRVYLVRHAEADPGHPDELRPLTPAGAEQARLLGERLAGVSPRAVLSSPLLRARETAAAIARAADLEVLIDERLAPGASVASLLSAVEGHEQPVVVVGHQPDCGEIVAGLRGGEPPPYPPGGVQELDLLV
jgi:phosphohistidine phosphatase